MGISGKNLKENKGMVAVLGVLIVACGVVVWFNMRGDTAPPVKPVQIETVAPTPEAKKHYEQQAEQAKKGRPPSGA